MGHRPPGISRTVATRTPTPPPGAAPESVGHGPRSQRKVSGFDDFQWGTVFPPSLACAAAGADAGAGGGRRHGRRADRTPPRLGRPRRCPRPVLDRCARPGLAGAGARRFRQRPGPRVRSGADHAAGRRRRGLVPPAAAGRRGPGAGRVHGSLWRHGQRRAVPARRRGRLARAARGRVVAGEPMAPALPAPGLRLHPPAGRDPAHLPARPAQPPDRGELGAVGRQQLRRIGQAVAPGAGRLCGVRAAGGAAQHLQRRLLARPHPSLLRRAGRAGRTGHHVAHRHRRRIPVAGQRVVERQGLGGAAGRQPGLDGPVPARAGGRARSPLAVLGAAGPRRHLRC